MSCLLKYISRCIRNTNIKKQFSLLVFTNVSAVIVESKKLQSFAESAQSFYGRARDTFLTCSFASFPVKRKVRTGLLTKQIETVQQSYQQPIT